MAVLDMQLRGTSKGRDPTMFVAGSGWQNSERLHIEDGWLVPDGRGHAKLLVSTGIAGRMSPGIRLDYTEASQMGWKKIVKMERIVA